MDDFIKWIVANHYGDLASVVAVAISIIGFFFTLLGVFKTKSAAERAETAASELRDSFKLFDAISECSSAISAMEEIKRLQRAAAWSSLTDRYSHVKRQLIAIKAAKPGLTDQQEIELQSAIQMLTDLETAFEKSIRAPETLNVPKLNIMINSRVDALTEMLVQLKDRLGKQHG